MKDNFLDNVSYVKNEAREKTVDVNQEQFL